MVWNEKLITEQLCQVFKSGGNECIPLYGREVNFRELQKRLEKNEVTTYIHYSDRITDQIPIITDGYWRSGTMYVETNDYDERVCLLKMVEFLKMGCTQKYNSISIKRTGPFQIGGKNFLRWWPMQLNPMSENKDEYFKAINFIDIQFTLN
jgi:hypothetical protein